jgi:SAM-dependent methyltransferase
VSFDVPADAYGRFMGRFSEPLAVVFADEAGVRTGQRALDVGCGPGALTNVLVQRLGASSVAAVDPSEPFVAAAQVRFPDVDVRSAAAEDLPFDDDTFDAVLAELVVHFMADPVAGLREMARVARPDGVVAACVWDNVGPSGPLTVFWDAVHDIDPGVEDESGLAGSREGHLATLAEAAGLRDIRSGVVTVHVPFESFEQWWEPFTFGVGPSGAYTAQLDDAQREELRARCEQRLPAAPFEVAGAGPPARVTPGKPPPRPPG